MWREVIALQDNWVTGFIIPETMIVNKTSDNLTLSIV